MITVDGSDVFVSSSICNWTLQYNIDVPEGIIFKDYAGVASGHVGACYGGSFACMVLCVRV